MEWNTLHILRPGPTTIWIQMSRSSKMGQHFDLRRFLCPRLMTSIWKRKFRWVTLSNNSTLFHDPIIGKLMKFPWNHNLPLRTACGQLRRRISFPKVHYLGHYGTAWSDHISALMSGWLIVFGMLAKKKMYLRIPSNCKLVRAFARFASIPPNFFLLILHDLRLYTHNTQFHLLFCWCCIIDKWALSYSAPIAKHNQLFASIIRSQIRKKKDWACLNNDLFFIAFLDIWTFL